MATQNTVGMKLFTSNATRSVVDALVLAFERASGCKVTVIHDSAKVMLARIKNGETADVAVLLKHAIDELVQLNRITAASRRPFARSIVGIGVLAGQPLVELRMRRAEDHFHGEARLPLELRQAIVELVVGRT